jgi:hypothetical protein
MRPNKKRKTPGVSGAHKRRHRRLGTAADLRRWRSPAGPFITPFDEITPPQLEGNMRVAQFIIESAVAPTKISKCGSEEPMR